MAYIYNEQDVTNRAITIDDIQYPAGTWAANSIDYATERGVIWVDDPPEPELVPLPVTSISPRQARLVLARYGLLDVINATVAGMGAAAAIEWEYANEVLRDNDLLNTVATMAGMTAEQVDNMFTEAAEL